MGLGLLLTSVLQAMSLAAPSVPTLKGEQSSPTSVPRAEKVVAEHLLFLLVWKQNRLDGGWQADGELNEYTVISVGTPIMSILATAPLKAPASVEVSTPSDTPALAWSGHCALRTPASVLVAPKSWGSENEVDRLLEGDVEPLSPLSSHS